MTITAIIINLYLSNSYSSKETVLMKAKMQSSICIFAYAKNSSYTYAGLQAKLF